MTMTTIPEAIDKFKNNKIKNIHKAKQIGSGAQSPLFVPQTTPGKKKKMMFMKTESPKIFFNPLKGSPIEYKK